MPHNYTIHISFVTIVVVVAADNTRLKRARSEKFFLRMYGKLFVLTAYMASMCPQRPGIAAFRALTPGTFARETRWIDVHV